MRILAARPESMEGAMSRALTLEPMGTGGKGSCLRGYNSVNIQDIPIMYASKFIIMMSGCL